MDNVLPTYQMATSQDHWMIIAPYIASPDLCSAALVCSRWHEMFAPHLWGNPASHFGTEHDAVYVALTRFKRTLAWARLYVRRMTHTFHLPPAHPEMYEGPHSDWLRNVLERLPNMQSLVVNGLPFFDHAALVTLRHQSNIGKQPRFLNSPPIFGALRFLDAQKCSNATPVGLAEALKHFPGLLYVDLSQTVAAKAPGVLSIVGSLPCLQILKLNNIGLKDEDITVLISNMGLRTRSLDLRNNVLTDTSVRSLLEKCFKIVHSPVNDQGSNFAESGSWPSRVDSAYIGDVLRHTQDEGLDHYLRKRLTSELVGRLAIEDTQPGGITHFYISGNRLTAEGILALLRSTNLCVLDAGDVVTELPETTLLSPPPEYGSWESLMLPGVEKLIPVIAAASRDLTYLRINHAILTESAPVVCTAPPPLPVLAAELEVPANSAARRTPLSPQLSGGTTPRTDDGSEAESHGNIDRAELGGDDIRAELDNIILRPALNGDSAFAELESTPSVLELPGDTVRMSQHSELPGDTVRISNCFELAGEPVRSSRISELTGSTPHVYVSDTEDTLNSDPSEWSMNSALSRGPTIFIVAANDTDDDGQPSLVINAAGTGLTTEASAMNGTSSLVLSRRPTRVSGDLVFAAPSSEWSWDSTASEKITVVPHEQETYAIPNDSNSSLSTASATRSNTSDQFKGRSISSSSAKPISPLEYGNNQNPSLNLNEHSRCMASMAAAIDRTSRTPNNPPTNNNLNAPTPTQSVHRRPTTPPDPTPQLQTQQPQPLTRTHRTYSSIIAERRARAAHNTLYPTLLRPSMLPHLRTLVLTSVPATSPTANSIHRLQNYLTACAEESHLARQQAQLGYAMPPGQRGCLQAQREYARSIFALERIVLEIAPTVPESGGGKKKTPASWRKYPTKSSTEDADSENFWDAAQYDFSFFGDEECGQPVLGLGAGGGLGGAGAVGGRLPGPVATGLMVVGDEEGRVERERYDDGAQRLSAGTATATDESNVPKFDLVAEISRFRRERKKRHELGVREAARSRLMKGKGRAGGGGGSVGVAEASSEPPVVEGYWEGEVKVVR